MYSDKLDGVDISRAAHLARIGPYDGRQDFHSKTDNKYKP